MTLSRKLSGRFGTILFAVALLLGTVFSVMPLEAEAAACTNGSGYGIVTFGNLSVPSPGTYYIWSRISVPVSGTGYQQEINGSICYQATTMTTDKLVWTNTGGAGKTSFYFDSAMGNSIKMIGLAPGVKVDRIALCSDPNFVPVDTGEGCTTTVATLSSGNEAGDFNSVTGTLPAPTPPNQVVSGGTNPSRTLSTTDARTVATVAFYADGRKVQSSTGPKLLDTTLLTDGKHNIETKITFKDGSSTSELTVINVLNPQTFFSPYRRWARINQRSVIAVSTVLGATIVFVSGFMVASYLYRRNRRLHFHGF